MGAINRKKTLYIIIGAAFALSTLVIILGYMSFSATEKSIVKEYNKRQILLAQQTAKVIEQHIDVFLSEMHAISYNPDVRTFEEKETRKLLKHGFSQLKDHGVNDLGVLDSKGVLRYGVNAPFLEGKSFAWRTYFKKVRKATTEDQFCVEFLEFKGVDAGKKGLLIAKPMLEEKNGSRQFIGVMLITIYVDYINDEFIAPLKSSADGGAYLLDQHSFALYSSNKKVKDKNLIKQSKAGGDFLEVIKAMTKGQTGSASYKPQFAEAKDDEILIGYAPAKIGDTLWSIGAWAPKGAALELTRTAANRVMYLVIAVLLLIIGGAGFGMATTNRVADEQEKSKLQFQRIAQVLQSALLKVPPEIRDVDLAVVYESAHEVEKVGGDFYDVFEKNDNTIVAVIGDVAGKGVSAAAYTESVRSSIRTLAYSSDSPADILNRVNEVLIHQTKKAGFVTVSLLMIDARKKQIVTASAGHPPFLIIAKKPHFAEIAQSQPLGLGPEEFIQNKVKLEKNQGILLYTDGLVEARNDGELFGDARLAESVRVSVGSDSETIARGAVEAAKRFAAGRLQDDVAVVALQFKNDR